MINPWGLRVQFILEGGCLLKQEVSTSHHPSSRSRLAPSPFDAHILHASKRHRLDSISILDTNPVVNRASEISATRRVDTVPATDQHDTAHLLQSFANPVCASIYGLCPLAETFFESSWRSGTAKLPRAAASRNSGLLMRHAHSTCLNLRDAKCKSTLGACECQGFWHHVLVSRHLLASHRTRGRGTEAAGLLHPKSGPWIGMVPDDLTSGIFSSRRLVPASQWH